MRTRNTELSMGIELTRPAPAHPVLGDWLRLGWFRYGQRPDHVALELVGRLEDGCTRPAHAVLTVRSATRTFQCVARADDPALGGGGLPSKMWRVTFALPVETLNPGGMLFSIHAAGRREATVLPRPARRTNARPVRVNTHRAHTPPPILFVEPPAARRPAPERRPFRALGSGGAALAGGVATALICAGLSTGTISIATAAGGTGTGSGTSPASTPTTDTTTAPPTTPSTVTPPATTPAPPTPTSTPTPPPQTTPPPTTPTPPPDTTPSTPAPPAQPAASPAPAPATPAPTGSTGQTGATGPTGAATPTHSRGSGTNGTRTDTHHHAPGELRKSDGQHRHAPGERKKSDGKHRHPPADRAKRQHEHGRHDKALHGDRHHASVHAHKAHKHKPKPPTEPAATPAPSTFAAESSFNLNPFQSAQLSHLSAIFSDGSRQPPRFLIPIYKHAGRKYHVPWRILAAINWIETDYGRNLNVSSAGAMGWMQFMPATWAEWATTASGKGRPNPYDPRDAIFSAARYLAAAGARTNIRRAVFAYNHALWYVDAVMWQASLIRSHGAKAVDEHGYALPLDRRYMRTLGRSDDGVDIEDAPDGAAVYSITSGTVTAVARDPGGFGPNYPVILATTGPLAGQYIYYGHVAASLVKVGESVAAGQPIAIMGHTGDAASLRHGHIEIGFSNGSGDPLDHHGGGPDAATPAGLAMRELLVSLSDKFDVWGTRREAARDRREAARERRHASRPS